MQDALLRTKVRKIFFPKIIFSTHPPVLYARSSSLAHVWQIASDNFAAFDLLTLIGWIMILAQLTCLDTYSRSHLLCLVFWSCLSCLQSLIVSLPHFFSLALYLSFNILSHCLNVYFVENKLICNSFIFILILSWCAWIIICRPNLTF